MFEPTTLHELKTRLATLPRGESFGLRAAVYVKLFEGSATNAWAGSRVLGDECRCSVEFRPGGSVWFVRRLASLDPFCATNPSEETRQAFVFPGSKIIP